MARFKSSLTDIRVALCFPRRRDGSFNVKDNDKNVLTSLVSSISRPLTRETRASWMVPVPTLGVDSIRENVRCRAHQKRGPPR